MDAIAGTLTSASKIQSDYLNLLVTQLKNQNPLDPMDHSEMAAQLAMLSQLEQLENQTRQLQSMEGTFQEALVTAQRRQATELIGKTVSFFAELEEGGHAIRWAEVDRIDLADGQVRLRAGDYILGLGAIQTVED
ncbi:MAG: hypothetical protein KAX78_01785 [Phycisphaerae bacterium]|nr:hypothetical protein [Phycisphaerae bacterium]